MQLEKSRAGPAPCFSQLKLLHVEVAQAAEWQKTLLPPCINLHLVLLLALLPSQLIVLLNWLEESAELMKGSPEPESFASVVFSATGR